LCYLFRTSDLQASTHDDTGIRQSTVGATQSSGQPVASTSFAIRRSIEATGTAIKATPFTSSFGECERICEQTEGCNVFTYVGESKLCYVYRNAGSRSNERYDTGVRKSIPGALQSSGEVAAPLQSSGGAVATASFAVRRSIEATGSAIRFVKSVASFASCERICKLTDGCNVFTYGAASQFCHVYRSANFRSNEHYDTGVRK
jgi:hypothetical protein